jgi:putative ABC transport system permease protein
VSRPGRTRLLRLRWSWRDLRARWLQVAAIALIIGIGSGTYSGLTSVSAWRRTSYDASYRTLDMYDLRVELADGSYVDADALVAAVNAIDSASDLDNVEARLIQPTQVDASSSDELVLVPGRLVGVDVRVGGPHVNRVEALDGRNLEAADDGANVAVLGEHFADEHDISPGASLLVSGEHEIDIVGRGLSPDDFIVIGDQGSLFADFAVLYAPLGTVQQLSGRSGQANDVVLTVQSGGDRDRVEAQVRAALTEAFPDTGFTITPREDDEVLRLLYDDIDGDQRFYNIFAILILAGAAFAAFNLIVRIVESQRREIGIGMALGVPPSQIAVRPLLVGAQVALVGVVFGVAVGLLIDSFMADLLRSFQPLPVWNTDFQPGVFVRGAALGLLLPFVATVVPVLRAVRVAPVDAISTTHRAAGSGLAPLLRRVPLPGSSIVELPFRNVLREPRRTLLTAFGIAAAITTLVGVVGVIDSFLVTIDRGDEEILGETPDRLTVSLDSFYPDTSAQVQAVVEAPSVVAAEPGLRIGGALAPGTDDEIEVLLSAIDFDSEIWRPTAIEGMLRTDEPGLVIAEKAADDLDLDVGDPVTLRHPRREGAAGYTFVETELPVRAIHPNPYRFVAFVDRRWTELMGAGGIANMIQVVPAAGSSVEDVQRELFGTAGVASVDPVSAAADAIRDRIGEALGIFTVIQGMVLVLALLIAFNSTAINMDERARENATMLAFGLRVRSVLGVAVTESVIIGIIGTVLGVVFGRLLLEWLIRVLIPDTFPDIGIDVYLAGSTIATAIAFGVVAVAVAPLFTLRRLRSMDIPSTLRVVE